MPLPATSLAFRRIGRRAGLGQDLLRGLAGQAMEKTGCRRAADGTLFLCTEKHPLEMFDLPLAGDVPARGVTSHR
jgi:hypothetical protein